MHSVNVIFIHEGPEPGTSPVEDWLRQTSLALRQGKDHKKLHETWVQREEATRGRSSDSWPPSDPSSQRLAQSVQHRATPKKQRRSMNMQSPSESCHPLWDSRVLLPVPSTHGVLFNLTIKHNTGCQSKPGTLTSRHPTTRPPGGPRCPTTRCCLCHGSSNCPDPGLTPRGLTYRQALEPDFPWRLGSSVARNAPGATPLPP